jgi:tektin-3
MFNSVSNPESWVKFTQENIERSKRERNISEKLRFDIEVCLRQCANDMWSQFQFINNALKARVAENTDIKNKLEKHLQKVVSDFTG